MSACAVETCDRPAKTRGWCGAHAERVRQHGEPRPDVPITRVRLGVPALDRVLDRIVMTEGNHNHVTGSHDTRGYANVSDSGRPRRAHQVVWESIHGPVPEGYELDHRCTDRACVNPEHLRLLTHRENSQAQVNPRANPSGFRGATPAHRRWEAGVRADDVLLYLGHYDTAEVAGEAARLGRLVLHEAHAAADTEPLIDLAADERSSVAEKIMRAIRRPLT